MVQTAFLQAEQTDQLGEAREDLTASPIREERDSQKESGLTERQKRRRRIGWALQQRRAGQELRKGPRTKKEDSTSAKLTREKEVQLCKQIQVRCAPPSSLSKLIVLAEICFAHMLA